MELRYKGSKSISVKMMMFVFIVELGLLAVAIIVGYEAQSTRFPMEL
jgi:septal ring-binding cell division protein DamX